MNDYIEMKGEKVSAGTIARTVLLFAGIINLILKGTGHDVLPFDDKQISDAVSYVFMAVTALVAWWKNNSFTEAARVGDRVMNLMKRADNDK